MMPARALEPPTATGQEAARMNGIPLVDLLVQHVQIAEEVEDGFVEVLLAGDFIGGKAVSAFEQEYAEFVGVRSCIGMANGTDALEMALRAVRVGRGDEVIVPANTFIATAEAVIRAGARPVLVDVDDDALLIDPARVAAAVTARTRAVIPVHLYGQVAPVEQLPPELPERDELLRQLNAEGIGAGVHYPVPVHLTPAMSWLAEGPGSFPVSERAAGQILSLPLFPGITPAQQERVVEVIRTALDRRTA
jgi:dTDP-4-amino-4,6-dideoxygalactose transaminase